MGKNTSYFKIYNRRLMSGLLESEEKFEWMDRAACKGQPMNFFSFPDLTSQTVGFEVEAEAIEDIKQGIKICNDCPVASECLKFATEDDLRFTVRGGKWPKRVSMSARGRPRNVAPDTGYIITRFRKRDYKKFSAAELAALDLRVSKGGACPSRHIINSRDCLVPKRNGAYIKALCRACIMDRNNEYKRRQRENATMGA